MIKKLGSFLLIMLMICAALLLMATESRGEQKEQLSGAKPVKLQSSDPQAPSAATDEDTTPGETEPQEPDATETTIPQDAPQQPVGDGEPLPELSEATLEQVRKILDGESLAKTARSHWIWKADLNFHEDTTGTALSSTGWALSLLSAERKMNPIAAFWVLNRKGLYSKTEDDLGVLATTSFAVPVQTAKTYGYTDEGARQLLTDLLTLAGGLEDGLQLESGLLGANGAVDPGQVALDRKAGCYYGYFISGGERSTHILCFYLRSDREGKNITDVEFQLLNLRSAQGSEEALARLDRRGDNQAAALMAAAELLLTGQTQAGQGMVPYTRQVTSYTATIERFHFTAQDETGTLTNYRLRKG